MHYYTQTGQPMHFVPKKDGSGNRPTTIADARKLNLLPSVTTVIDILRKPALEKWLITQAVHAVTTAPDRPGESLDDKLTRILEVECQQDEEAAKARDLGTRIHDALEARLQGREVDPDLLPWIEPAVLMLSRLGQVAATEIVLVGEGYAGKADLIMEAPNCWWLWDFKTTKNLPKGDGYRENFIQLAAYANIWHHLVHENKPVRTGNIYISTTQIGQFIVCERQEWKITYEEGFDPLLKVWRFLNDYHVSQQFGVESYKANGVEKLSTRIDQHPNPRLLESDARTL